MDAPDFDSIPVGLNDTHVEQSTGKVRPSVIFSKTQCGSPLLGNASCFPFDELWTHLASDVQNRSSGLAMHSAEMC